MNAARFLADLGGVDLNAAGLSGDLCLDVESLKVAIERKDQFHDHRGCHGHGKSGSGKGSLERTSG